MPEVAAPGDPATCAQEQATGRKLGVTERFLAAKPEAAAVRAGRVPPTTIPSRSVIGQ